MERQRQQPQSANDSRTSSIEPPHNQCHLPLHIEEISREFGNPLIARGAFGEVSIAIQLPAPPTATFFQQKQQQNEHHNNNPTNDDASASSPSPSPSSSSSSLRHPPKARFLALKTIHNAVHYKKDRGYEFSSAACTELESLRALTPHANIVPLLGIDYDNKLHEEEGGGKDQDLFSAFSSSSFTTSNSSTCLKFIFPYCPSDLQEIISHRRQQQHQQRHCQPPQFTKQIIQYIMKDICIGLAHCHAKGILHCDIKPGNILLSSKGIFQLADFGIASTTFSKNNANNPIHGHLPPPPHGLCTLYYRAPELLYGSRTYQPSIDMWGVGLILSELYTLRPLFAGSSVIDQLSRIMDVLGTPTIESFPSMQSLPDYGKITFRLRKGIGLCNAVPHACLQEDDDLANLMDHLVIMNSDLRLDAKECLDHVWMKSLFEEDDMLSSSSSSRPFMIQALICNADVLGDDGFNNDESTSSLCRGDGVMIENMLDDEILLEEMKLTGFKMATARRNLSKFECLGKKKNAAIMLEKSNYQTPKRTDVNKSKGLAQLLAHRMKGKEKQ